MFARNSTAVVVLACLIGMAAAHLIDRLAPLQPPAPRSDPDSGSAPQPKPPVTPGRPRSDLASHNSTPPALELSRLSGLASNPPAGRNRDLFAFAPNRRRATSGPIASASPVPLTVTGTTQPQAAPSAPPLTPLFFGYANPLTSHYKSAFFLDDDVIRILAEGESISPRYRLLQIGAAEVIVEDRLDGVRRTLRMLD